MTKFVLDTEGVGTIAEMIKACYNDLENVKSSIQSYDVGDALDFNFEGAKKAILSNVDESVNKMNNSFILINDIIDSHSNLQGTFHYEVNLSQSSIQNSAINLSTVSENNVEVLNANNSSNDSSSQNSNYTVVRGDSLSKIALKYGTTVAALAAANNIKNVDLIYTGQNLVIPSNDTSTEGNSKQTVSQDKTTDSKESKSSSNVSQSSVTNQNSNGTVYKAEFTAYYPSNDPMEGGLNDCKGKPLNPDNLTCAAPKNIPYGTKIQISGTGTSYDGKIFTVTDRGGAIKIKDDGTYRIDILMSDGKQCNQFGRRGGQITILD